MKVRRTWAAYSAAAGALVGLLCGCAGSDTVGSLLVSPGKYDLYSCEQLAARLKPAATREKELRGLIAKAERDTSGVVVSALAYRTEYATARGDLRQIEETSQRKQCPPPK
ncbi:MAG TPA: twin-arginine translocation pathway signal [Xanthobacteraceae bacterium]